MNGVVGNSLIRWPLPDIERNKSFRCSESCEMRKLSLGVGHSHKCRNVCQLRNRSRPIIIVSGQLFVHDFMKLADLTVAFYAVNLEEN
ncbi:hypothetical protein TNCV_1289121 [Trichonephila clavipes]|nr:hypothetical protein TNCV_1289121 [Trichonephila clavipes]